MEEPAKLKEVNKIQTFVFLDLESTGLWGSNPRIVELSMIAVSRAHLLEMTKSASTCSPSHNADEHPSTSQATVGATASTNTEDMNDQRKNVVPKLPRVVHKYTRLYYPWKLLPPLVEKVNGLNNEALEHLPAFTEASAQALTLFLDLPKPVALVAHNGYRFDFPLLMAELKKVDYVDKFLDLQCTDSLSAVKDIDALIEREDITEITKLAESFSFNDLDDELLGEKELSPSKRTRSVESDEERGSLAQHSPNQSHESNPHGRGNNQLIMEVSVQPLMTPVKNHLMQASIPSTPTKPSHPLPPPCTPESSQPRTPGTPGFNTKVVKESSKVRRTLTYENNGKRKLGARLSYSQPILYKRLFDCDYAAHRAETDCEALLTICGHYGSRFIEWADTFSISFSNVKPMWVKRKCFKANEQGF